MGQSCFLDFQVRVAAIVGVDHSQRLGALASATVLRSGLSGVGRSPDHPLQRDRVNRSCGKPGSYETFLVQTIEAKPDITMPELAAHLLEEHGIAAARAIVSRRLC